MPTTPVTLLPGTLPYLCYPTEPQTLNTDIVTRIQAFLSEAFPGIYVGPTAPPVDQRNRLWFNTDSASFRWYQYVNGDWMRTYEIPASTALRWMWQSTEAALKTFAGGDVNAVGAWSGPLWEIDHDYDGRVPLGVGDVPGTTTPAITTAIGDTTGASEHTLTEAEGANGVHTHGFGKFLSGAAGLRYIGDNTVPTYTGAVVQGISAGVTGPDTVANLFTLPSGLLAAGVPTPTPFQIIPQAKATYIIKRTARIWVLSPY
jgi:hypothetical protein